ncbi:hypothetical protein AB0D08_39235 [Kitasatospora sp. NPDC048540]|uniref:hypothetical protein n=1 Tax=Kitasatospora sp. NPDC048540 TaxID=3155634 RepID=UPI0033DCB2E4
MRIAVLELPLTRQWFVEAHRSSFRDTRQYSLGLARRDRPGPSDALSVVITLHPGDLLAELPPTTVQHRPPLATRIASRRNRRALRKPAVLIGLWEVSLTRLDGIRGIRLERQTEPCCALHNPTDGSAIPSDTTPCACPRHLPTFSLNLHRPSHYGRFTF